LQSRIQGFEFDNPVLKKMLQLEFFFLNKKMQFTYHKASVKDAQAAEEAFSPSKENIQHCKT
jgi:hypothetical protein